MEYLAARWYDMHASQEWDQVEIQAKPLRSAAPEETPKVRSEGLGVSVAYLLGEFADDARNAAREAKRDPEACFLTRDCIYG